VVLLCSSSSARIVQCSQTRSDNLCGRRDGYVLAGCTSVLLVCTCAFTTDVDQYDGLLTDKLLVLIAFLLTALLWLYVLTSYRGVLPASTYSKVMGELLEVVNIYTYISHICAI
jgi:hypothetical protein